MSPFVQVIFIQYGITKWTVKRKTGVFHLGGPGRIKTGGSGRESEFIAVRTPFYDALAVRSQKKEAVFKTGGPGYSVVINGRQE